MQLRLDDRLELAVPAAGVQAERTDVRLLRAVRGPMEGLAASADELRRAICVRGVARLLFEVEGFDCLRSMLLYDAAVVRRKDQASASRPKRRSKVKASVAGDRGHGPPESTKKALN